MSERVLLVGGPAHNMTIPATTPIRCERITALPAPTPATYDPQITVSPAVVLRRLHDGLHVEGNYDGGRYLYPSDYRDPLAGVFMHWSERGGSITAHHEVDR